MGAAAVGEEQVFLFIGAAVQRLSNDAGALETILTIQALNERTAPPTINIENLDEKVRVDVAANTARPLSGEGRLAGLNNAFGFGGHNVALLLLGA